MNLSAKNNRFLPLLPILCLFTVTFFIYRDLDIRMLLGFGVLCLILLVHLLQRLAADAPLSPGTPELAMAFLALAIVLAFLMPDARRDADSLSYLIAMLVCTAFVWLHRAERTRTRRSLNVLLAGGCAMAVFSLVCGWLKEPFYAYLYPHLSQVARNYLDYFVPKGYGIALGGYTFADYVLFTGIAVCLGRMCLTDKLRDRILLALCAAVMLFVILSLGRRGELLGALVCILIFLLILCSRKQRLIIVLGGGALAAIALALFLKFLPQLREIPIFYRYVITVEALVNGYDFTSGRTGLFALAIEGFRSAPWFGIGFDQFHTLVNPLLTDIEGKVIQDAHNIYLQMLCETGIVGTVLTLLPMGYLFVTTCRMLRHAKGLEDREPLCAVTVSFLIQFYLLFLGLYDPTFQKIVFWCFYAVAVMLLRDAMTAADWRPAGPVSRVLDRLAARLAPLGVACWRILRTPWKEGRK